MLDLLFKNVSVVDGTGSSTRVADVGVKEGKITFMTRGEAAEEVIDGEGLTLCPGFIDSHSHGDTSIGMDFAMLCKLSQGVTTEVGGQCGLSAFPVDMRFYNEVKGTMESTADFSKIPFEKFSGYKEYEEYAQSILLKNNMMSLVGHNTLRVSVMGVENRPATEDELELMKERLRSCMEAGALGLSSGLIYIPGVYSNTEELVELCKVIKPYGGIYATHMRNEARNVVDSVKESIYIAETAGVPLVISHHKVCGRNFWGQSEETLRLVDEANDRGVTVYMDQYPYEANMTGLKVCIPPQYFSEGIPALVEHMKDPAWREKVAAEMNDPNGGYDNFYLNSGGFTGVFISTSPKVPEAEGMTVAEYAEKVGKDPMDTYFDLLVANECVGEGIYFAMNLAEVEKIYCHPHTMVGSDGLCLNMEEKGHPRAWGTFIRPLTLFCQEKGLVTFEEAIRKQTSLTAEVWGIPNKGRIAEGYDADLVLLDRKALKETATWKDSNQKAEGIKAVYVMGKCAYRDKQMTGECAGRLLTRKRVF